MPVHLGGSAADLDTILDVARKRGVPVIEDACQAHLAEWRGRKVGTLGDRMLQLPGEQEPELRRGRRHPHQRPRAGRACYRFHNNSRGRRNTGDDFSYGQTGANLRMTEFQGALLLAQMTRLEEQSRTREQNAAHLTSLLKQIPGITPARMYEGCTRNAYHLYMFRYDPAAFSGLPRATFLKALAAEGVPASGGYSPLNKEPFLEHALSSRGFKAIYSKAQLDAWRDRNRCPENDRLCTEAVWLTQTMLLGPRQDMEDIAEAVRKIQAHAGRLVKEGTAVL